VYSFNIKKLREIKELLHKGHKEDAKLHRDFSNHIRHIRAYKFLIGSLWFSVDNTVYHCEINRWLWHKGHEDDTELHKGVFADWPD
jgi:hypothetical protein